MRSSYISRKPLPAIPTKDVDVLEKELERPRRTVKPWRPVTLRPLYLVSFIFITLGLIFIIQWLLYISRRDQGILFATDINNLPLSRSFGYLYLPTIVSVIYSFLWTWVDLDVKRLEPYFQLSTVGGVAASTSILLSYPMDFLAFIPFTSFKHKHWSVLTASVATISILWGLTPTQAGMFAVRPIRIRETVGGSRSTSYTPISEQGNLTAIYAQSVYNIAWLNESLPAYMTKNYILASFEPSDTHSLDATNITYTGTTTMYSIDMTCEEPVLANTSGQLRYNTSQGCSFYPPPFRPVGGNDTSKPFDTMYVGYQNQNGVADYYLSYDCDERFFHSFFIRWSKATVAAIESGEMDGSLDPSQANATSLFCTPSYYQQEVNATISWPSKAVLEVQPEGGKLPLPGDLFNVSALEWTMNSGVTKLPTRTSFPRTGFPDQKSQLVNMPLNLAYVPRMAPFAIATFQRPLEEYLNPENLRLSYQSAYRLLFARQLVDILDREVSGKGEASLKRLYNTQAVVLVPGFSYAATCLLLLVLILTVILLIHTPKRANKLEGNPATIGDLMDLVVGESRTLKSFSDLDSTSSEELQEALQGASFCLSDSRIRTCTSQGQMEVQRSSTGSTAPTDSLLAPASPMSGERSLRGVRPAEMKFAMGIAFFTIQVAAIITFLVLYVIANFNNGFALPSSSTFVRQLVQNYIPIALATSIEPCWLILNRLLCLLQPFEELRKGNAAASRSIDLDYSSFPPQLLFGRALRSGHVILGLVSLMVLLANALAVALSGLMYEGTRIISTSTELPLLHAARFGILNGTGLPFNTDVATNWQGGTTFDPFYRQMSNLTANTPLPAWSDERYAYLPAHIAVADSNTTFQFDAQYFGADLNCQTLYTTGPQRYNLTFSEDANDAYLTVILSKDESTVACTNFQTSTTSSALRSLDSQPGHVALEINSLLSSNKSATDDLFCRQHIFAGWIRADWEVMTGKGAGKSDNGYPKMWSLSKNETMLLCSPTLTVGTAEIVVDGDGNVQKSTPATLGTGSIDAYFASSPLDLIAQANQFLVDSGSTWHNDSNPSDFVNYLIATRTNDTTLLDPSRPVPKPKMAAIQMEATYRRLFATLVGSNTELLFERASGDSKVSGVIFKSETRILFSESAFAVTQAILACYIITTVFFYVRRPWRILPRLPSTVASTLAYFAASRAVQDLHSAQHIDPDTTMKSVRSLWKWGYGGFIGKDGATHLGIEREPLIATLKQEVSKGKAVPKGFRY